MDDALQRGRAAYDRQAWSDAHAVLADGRDAGRIARLITERARAARGVHRSQAA